MPRRIGLDVHREFVQIAVWEDGVVRQAGQIAATPEGLRAFADSGARRGSLLWMRTTARG